MEQENNSLTVSFCVIARNEEQTPPGTVCRSSGPNLLPFPDGSPPGGQRFHRRHQSLYGSLCPGTRRGIFRHPGVGQPRKNPPLRVETWPCGCFPETSSSGWTPTPIFPRSLWKRTSAAWKAGKRWLAASGPVFSRNPPLGGTTLLLAENSPLWQQYRPLPPGCGEDVRQIRVPWGLSPGGL